MKFLGIIPARGGSKGIPLKNIRSLAGKPLLEYTIKAALDSGALDEVVISTDSEQIRDVSLSYGALCPFLRPSELSSDSSSDFDVIDHALTWFKQRNRNFGAAAYLRPTTPFKSAADIKGAVKAFKDSPSGILRSVTRSEGKTHPYWMFKIEKNGLATPFVDGISIRNYFQRQLLPPCFRLNGVIDIISSERLYTLRTLVADSFVPYEIPEERSLDIDTPLDLAIAEFLLQRGQIDAERN